NANPRQTLGPIRRKISGHHQSHRKSIKHRKRLAVHQERDDAFVQDRIAKIERFEKKIRARTRWACSGLKALKLHHQRAALYTGDIEKLAKPHSGPHRVPHRAIAPLTARHARLQPAATVAGALIYRRE